jgi:acyl carrier protein
LHSLTQSMPLDFFVLFSSTASVFGSAGQANYAAANAFLDGLAHYRHGQGLPGVSINWGPWSGSGMAAVRGKGRERRWASQGIGMIAPEQGLQALERLLRPLRPQVAVAPIQWSRLMQQFGGSVPPFLSQFARAGRGPARPGQMPDRDSGFLQALESAPPKERPAILAAYINQQIARVLGLDPSQPLDPRQPLNEMGIDSLMAVELRNALGKALGRTLPPTMLFDFPTIEALSVFLLDKVLALGQPVAVVEPGPTQERDQELEEMVAAVDSLSDEAAQNALRADGL